MSGSITLIEVRAHIERRLLWYEEDLRRHPYNSDLQMRVTEIHKELREILAMLYQVQQGGTG